MLTASPEVIHNELETAIAILTIASPHNDEIPICIHSYVPRNLATRGVRIYLKFIADAVP